MPKLVRDSSGTDIEVQAMSKNGKNNPENRINEWENLAASEIKAKDTSQIEWRTPEGSLVKPV